MMGSLLQVTNVDWLDLKVNIPKTLASYILQNGIRVKSSDLKSYLPCNWQKITC